MLTPKERMEILNKFWGYGNPETANILFIGIEEAGSWDNKGLSAMEYGFEKYLENEESKKILDARLNVIFNNEQSDKYYMTKPEWTKNSWSKYIRKEVDFKNNKTEKIQTYLSLKLQGINIETLEGGLEYWQNGNLSNSDNGFCSKHEFQSNVFPLGAQSEDTWNEEYPILFGVTESKDEYRENCKENRLKVLKILLETLIHNANESNKQLLIFIMGSDPKYYLKSVLCELGYIFPEKNSDFIKQNHRILRWNWSSYGNVWFTGHPSFGWINKEVCDRIIYNIREKYKFSIIQ